MYIFIALTLKSQEAMNMYKENIIPVVVVMMMMMMMMMIMIMMINPLK
jgi:hypothetical protein